MLSGGYVSGSQAPALMQEAILTLCGKLKDDAVSLADAIAPPDFILNSPIGLSDGQVGRKFETLFTKHSCIKMLMFVLKIILWYY